MGVWDGLAKGGLADGTNPEGIGSQGIAPEHACGSGGLPDARRHGLGGVSGSNGLIAFNGSFFIFTMQPDGTEFTQLTHTNGPSTGFLDRAPAWSADGSRIAFESDSQADRQHEQGLGRNIWAMRADGSGLTELTHTGDNLDAAWSPEQPDRSGSSS